jgi:hypothetical protein
MKKAAMNIIPESCTDNLEVIMEESLKHQTGYKRQSLDSM